jgi:hypothetical protein
VNRPRPAILPPVLAVALLAGCTKSSDDREQIRSVGRQQAAAFQAKDWKSACDTMSARMKGQIAFGAKLLLGMQGKGCPTAVGGMVALDEDPGIAIDPDKLAFTDIEVTGDHATAKVGRVGSGGGAPALFAREDGRWKVDAAADSVALPRPEGSKGLAKVLAPRLRVAERGFSLVGSGKTLYGAVIRNTSANDAVAVDVRIRLLTRDGRVTAAAASSLKGIPAGAAVDVGGDAVSRRGRAMTLEVAATASSGAIPGTVKLPAVSQVRLFRDRFGVEVSAVVTNTLDEAMSPVTDVFAVLRDGQGRIVGGAFGAPGSEIAAGGHATVTLGGFGDVSRATRAHVTADWEKPIVAVLP